MKKLALAVAAGVTMLAGAAVMNGPTGSVASSDVRVQATSPAAQQQKAPAPSEKQAVREQRALRDVKYRRGIPAAIKNRAGGERAHRRWRKAKASGRKAA